MNFLNKFKKYIFWLKTFFNKQKLHYLYLNDLLISDNILLYNWAKKNFDVPYPRFIKELIFKKYNLKSSIWVETGTHYGDTSAFLSGLAEKVITLEPSIEIYHAARENLKKFNNVFIENKTSEDGLEKVVEQIKDNSNVCFWLDGHYSEGNTFLGEKHSPIEIELDIIQKHIQRFDKVNILIDDFRLFQNYKSQDIYPNKKFLIDWVFKNKLIFEVEADIFIIIKD